MTVIHGAASARACLSGVETRSTSGQRSRSTLIALLLASAAIAPGSAIAATLDLGGATVTLGDLDVAPGTPYDDVSNGALRVSAPGDMLYTGILNDALGQLSVEKLGALTTLTLTGANTYSGDTRITGGTLRAGAANTLSASSLVRNGSLLDLNGFDQTIAGIVGSGDIINLTGPATLTIDMAGSRTMSGTISDAPGSALRIRKTGTGTQTLNGASNYAGGTELAGGMLGFGASTALGSGAIEFTTDGAILLATGNGITLANQIILTTDGRIDSNGHDPVFTGLIQGPGRLIKQGSSSIEIDNILNSYAGTDMEQGNILLGADNVLGAGQIRVQGASGLNAVNSALLSNDILLNANLTVSNPASVLELSGVVSGIGGVNVNDSATLILSGTNTYTGLTQLIGGGILGVTNDLAVGGGIGDIISAGPSVLFAAGPGPISLANKIRVNGVLTVGSIVFGLELAGAIQDVNAVTPGGLAIVGQFVSLSGANTYTGGTDVFAGTLQVVSTAGTGNTNVHGGAGLSGTGTLAGTTTVDGVVSPGIGGAGTLGFVDLSLQSGAALIFDFAAPPTIGSGVNDLIVVSNSLRLDGSLNINDLGGFGAGVYRLFDYAPGTLDDQGLVFGFTPAGYSLTLDTTVAGQINLIVALLGGGPFTYWDGTQVVANGDVDGGVGIWNAATPNWTNFAGDANGAYGGSVAVFAGPAGGDVTVVGTQTFDQLKFETGGYALAGGTLAGTSAAEIDVAGSLTAVIASDITAPANLTKSGTGFLRLEGNNTLGGLNVDAGTIVVGGTNALGGGPVSFANGTGISFETPGSYINDVVLNGSVGLNLVGVGVAIDGVVSGSGPLNIGGIGTLQLVNNNSYTGGTTLSGATTLQITNGGSLGIGQLTAAPGTTLVAGTVADVVINLANAIRLDGSFTLDLDPTNQAFASYDPETGDYQTLSTKLALDGAMSGSGNLIIRGSGELYLNGDNSGRTGSTDLGNKGVVVYLGSSNALGTGAVALGGFAALRNNTAGAQTFANAMVVTSLHNTIGGSGDIDWTGDISGPGRLDKVGADQLTLGGTNTYSGGTVIALGKLRVTNDHSIGTGILTMFQDTTLVAGIVPTAVTLANQVDLVFGNVTVDLLGTDLELDYSGNAVTDGSRLTLEGAVTGGGSLVIDGAGILALNGANTYSGGTTVDGALIRVGNDSALGSGAVTFTGPNISGLHNDSGTLVTIGNDIAFNNIDTTLGGGADLTLAGTLTGNSTLYKVGGGKLIISGDASGVGGNNMYAGAGTLQIDGTYGDGTGQVFVVNDGTLGGSGTIHANVAVSDGATLAPGSSPGTLTVVGNLSLSSGTNLDFQLGEANVPGGAFNDLIIVTGDIVADGLLNVTDSGAFGLGVYNLISYGGSLTDNGITVNSLPTGYTGLVQTAVSGQINLIVTMPGALVQYWDGGDFLGNGAIDGGNGTWNIGNTNWTTDAPSLLNATWQGGVAVFAGATGTVDVSQNQSFQGLQFTTDGYLIEGAGGLTVNGPTFISTGPGINATIDTAIGGVGSIDKQGIGRLILTTSNTYTGGTTLSAGILTVGNDAAIGTGALTMAGGTILEAGADGLSFDNLIVTLGSGRVDSGAGIFTLDNLISGPGSISQIGTGNLVLNSANTFTNLGINSGTVTLGNDHAAGIGGIAINNNATLAAGIDGLHIANVVTTTGNGLVDTNGFIFTLDGAVGGTGSISNVGGGNLVLNHANFFTNLGINTGTVTLGNDHAAGIGGIAINNDATLAAGIDGLHIANIVTTTGNGLVDTNGFIFTLDGAVGGAGSISNVGGGNLVLSHANFFTNLGINTGTVTLGNDQAAGIGGIALNNDATLAAGIDGLHIANIVTTTGNGLVDTNGFIFTLDGAVGGAGSISSVGGGNLVLNHANFFTNLGINTGTVTLGNDQAAGIGGIALNNDATLAAGTSGLHIANVITTTANGLIDANGFIFTLDGAVGGAGSISNVGGGNLVLNHANFFTNLGINTGTVTLGNDQAAGIGGIALNGGTTLAAGADNLVIGNVTTTTGAAFVDTQGFTMTMNGLIGGAGTIGKAGTGNLVLSQANLFTGLSIYQGTVTLGTDTAAGIGFIGINTGAILAAGTSGLVVANDIGTLGGLVDSGPGILTLSGNITGPGSVTKIGSGNLLLTGTNAFVGGLVVNQGTATLGNNSTPGTGSITIADGGILAAGAAGLVLANNVLTTGSGRVDVQNFTMTLDGVISGPGSISQIGAGNLILNGANSFAAGLGINHGTVTLGKNTSAGTGAIAINDGATLAAGVTGLTVGNNIETTGAGRIDSGAGVFTLNGAIGNLGGITKIGTGNLILNGISTYVGGTTVAAGRLTVAGALTKSTVTVGSGGTLAGTGTVAGLVAQSGSKVTPGATDGALGTLTVTGSAALAAGSTYVATIAGAASDRIAVGGAASLGGATLTLINGNTPGLFGQTYTILTAGGGRTGNFTPVFSQFSVAFKPTVLYGANDVRVRLDPASIVTLLGSGANGSSNITNIATAFDAAVAGGFNPQAYYNLFLQGPNLGASLNQLTGEINSANSRTALTDTRYIREAALDRLGASLGGTGSGRGDAVTTGDDDHSLAFWARGIGSWTDSDSDGNGAKLDINAKGVATGLDVSAGEWKLGAMFNYIHSDVDTTLLGRGKVETTGGAVYAGYRGDHGFAFGIGGGLSDVDTKATRSITVPGLTQSLRSHAGGTSYQVFGEVSYDLAAADNTRVEPFVRAAYVKYDAKGFSETGGFAGLDVAKKKYDLTTITAGLRGSVLLGGSAWLKGSAGYQNTSGDRAPLALVALQGTTSQAAIRSTPLDKSAFAGELGIDFRIGSSVTLGAGYNGVIGKNTQDHGVKGTLTIGF